MDIIRIEWVPFQKINARHTNTIPLTRYAYQNHMETHIPYIHIIRNQQNDFLLAKGIEAYNKLYSIDFHRSIPVYVITNPHITLLEWTYQLFQSCMQERVNHRLKYEYITLLLKETRNDIASICKHTRCTKENIYQLLFDSTIPEKYKDLAIKHNRIQLINSIATNPKLQNYRSVLYPAVFQHNNRLTYENLKLFLTYIDEGYQLHVNSILALENFNKIVDQAQALKYYWDSLEFPDTQIMEGIFYYKGDKHSRIKVRL
ncbi:hypothetical protein H8S33_13100 [Ornithinibacillus sp. BX22]|uniref:Uncharacterized protein n=1 Tax=Ornithinibacillus hominis TaxID=2763055 RepID=A0A923RL35_9BACI|nr:hypothetical protein [Ornithinibacillus hominis]MBC5637747.1 hypothetical protein [Ornithinibacillus hominis]